MYLDYVHVSAIRQCVHGHHAKSTQSDSEIVYECLLWFDGIVFYECSGVLTRSGSSADSPLGLSVNFVKGDR